MHIKYGNRGRLIPNMDDQGGGGTEFFNVTFDTQTLTLNKTYNEIKAAFLAGKLPIISISDGSFIAPVSRCAVTEGSYEVDGGGVTWASLDPDGTLTM